MASQRQIMANRRNAQNSSGPGSPEGKAVSSQNALKTGIDARSQVVSFENAADLEALTAEYYDRFAPTSPEERCLVDTLISSEWMRRRYMTVEARVWDRVIEKRDFPSGMLFPERPKPSLVCSPGSIPRNAVSQMH